MDMLSRVFAAIVSFLMCSAPAHSTSDIELGWDKVDFTAGAYRVLAHTDRETHTLGELRVWVNEVPVEVPKVEYENITYPMLERITVTFAVRVRGSAGPPEAWITIPFLVPDSKPSGGGLKSGGSKLIFLKGAEFEGGSVRSAPPGTGT